MHGLLVGCRTQDPIPLQVQPSVETFNSAPQQKIIENLKAKRIALSCQFFPTFTDCLPPSLSSPLSPSVLQCAV